MSLNPECNILVVLHANAHHMRSVMEPQGSETKEFDVPNAVAPPCIVEETTEIVSLWSGEAILTRGGKHLGGKAKVVVDTLPRPQIRFEFQGESADETKSQLEQLFQLVAGNSNALDEGCLDCGPPLGSLLVQPSNSKGDSISGGVDQWAKKPTDLFESAKLLIINGPMHHGRPLRVGNGLCRGRLQVATDEGVSVVVDRLFFGKQSRRSVFGFTHVAEIRFPKPEAMERFEHIETNLFRTLSLMRGRWVGIVGPWLYNGGELRAICPRVAKTERNGSSSNWCNESIRDAFEDLFSCLLTAYQNPERREALQTGLHWLIESQQCAGGVEGAIVLQQAALEALAWFDIVQNRKLCSASGFDKLPASDKIRWLASLYSIPIAIPTKSTELVNYAKEFEGINDLADILVDVRNALIHGSPKKVKRLFGRQRGAEERTELWWISTGLLEQAVLAIAGYRGKIQRRDTDAVFAASAVKQVPWA